VAGSWGGWEGEVEDGAVALGGFCGELAAVGFCDGAADGEAHAEAAWFGGMERLEEGFGWGGEACAGVCDVEEDGVLVEGGGESEGALVRRFGVHGVGGVGDEVEEELLEMDAFCHDVGEVWCEVADDVDVAGEEVVFEEVEGVVDAVVEVDGDWEGIAAFEETAEADDDVAGAAVFGDDVCEDVAEFCEVQGGFCDEVLGGLGVAEDGAEGLIEFVGEGGGEFAEGGGAGEVGEFAALAGEFCFGVAAVGDVEGDSAAAGSLRGGGSVGAAAGGDPTGGAIWEDDAVFEVVGGVFAADYGEDGAAVVWVDAVDDVVVGDGT